MSGLFVSGQRSGPDLVDQHDSAGRFVLPLPGGEMLVDGVVEEVHHESSSTTLPGVIFASARGSRGTDRKLKDPSTTTRQYSASCRPRGSPRSTRTVARVTRRIVKAIDRSRPMSTPSNRFSATTPATVTR